MTSTTGTDRPAGTQGFYHHDTSPQEARRLEAMARMRGDSVSFDSIRSLLDGEGGFEDRIVLDIGAGDSTSLGDLVSQQGGHYIPTDIRADAVDRQREHFPHAMVANVVDLSQLGELGPRVDVVHARAVFGWLGENQRTTALAALTEKTPHARLSITDYDWSVADGPEEYMDAIRAAMAVLASTGFRPEYGAYASDDLRRKVHEVLGADSSVAVETQRDEVGRGIPLEDAMRVVELTAAALIDQLQRLGMKHRAAMIQSSVDRLTEYAEQNPGELVSLPDLVTTRLSVIERADSEPTQAQQVYRMLQTISEPIGQRANSLPFTHTGMARTYLQRLKARQVQAGAYYLDDIVDASGIDQVEGTLSYAIDPIELVNRSDYVIAARESVVNALIRMIKPSEDGALSLPTVQRLQRDAPEAFAYLQSIGALSPEAKTFEVSGLAKNPLTGETADVLDAIIGLAYHATDENYDYAVMGLQERHVESIVAILGPDVIKRVPTKDAAHPIDLPGVNNRMNFVACYAEIEGLLERIHSHAASQRGPIFERVKTQAEIAMKALQTGAHYRAEV